MKLFIDTEVYSTIPIKFGTYRYAQGSELLLVSYAVDTDVVKVWDCSDPMPQDLGDAIREADEIWAHNAQFDRVVIRHSLGDIVAPHKWRCMMVRAYSASLPGSLDKLCEIMQVPVDLAKQNGKALIKKFCIPQANGTRLTKVQLPSEWEQFKTYAKNDIEAIRVLDKRIPVRNFELELPIWHLDQVINQRGFYIDVDLVQSAIRTVAANKQAFDEEMKALTGVENTRKRAEILEFIAAVYKPIKDLSASTLEKLLTDEEVPEGVKEIVRVRKLSSMSSVLKYAKLAECATGSYMRGTLQYNGAARTGRWAARLFQPHNLPRGKIDPNTIEHLVSGVKTGAVKDMTTLSSLLRSVIIAKPGHKLVVSDLSNIEGRMLAWLAEEEWKVKAFRDFDEGKGEDIYKLSYARTFNKDVQKVTKDERQIGKIQELALGYGGGVGAFVTFAKAYNLSLELPAQVPLYISEEARAAFHRSDKKFGLSESAYIACDSIKRLWRLSHPKVSKLWYGLQEACISAVYNPGNVYQCGRLRVEALKAWLYILLPSGRRLFYFNPKIIDDSLTYLGMNQYTRKFERIDTYGGKLVENCVQALSGHILKDSLHRIEDSGYPIVLTVHDEVITMPEDRSFYTAESLSCLLALAPEWAEDLPLQAKGFEAYRYRKD